MRILSNERTLSIAMICYTTGPESQSVDGWIRLSGLPLVLSRLARSRYGLVSSAKLRRVAFSNRAGLVRLIGITV